MKKNAKQEQLQVVATMRTRQLQRLMTLLQNGTVCFTYQKADGTLRQATGTLKDVDHLIKGSGKKTNKTVCYYDLEASAFRSFRVENLITID